MGARLNTFRAMFPEQKNKRRDETKKCTQFHPIWIFLFEVYGAALGMNFLLSGFMNIMLFPPNMPYNVNVDKQSDSRQIHNCFFANFTRAYLAFFYSHSYSKLIHYSIIFHPLLLPIVLYLYLSRGFSFLGLFCHYSLHLSCPAHTLSALSHVSFSVPLPHFETLARCRELYISLNIHCQFITPLFLLLQLLFSLQPDITTPLLTNSYTDANQHRKIFMQRAKDVTARIIQCLISSIWLKAFYSTNII